ncbi:hypothetical protein GH714_040361 [Hevea brasiliensis]|uniref:C3H1-type domain-containing protein n=1 Tax=Hevea brasiliensis TaxID=3981 RepID=A0A6A6KCP9_HEVBR|nr:hypothetical protein GH714_040361 [Hevea brasiliensis]
MSSRSAAALAPTAMTGQTALLPTQVKRPARRDPRKYHYSGTVCSEFRRGGCSRGDTCEFAHGVFEIWLHPSRYRTEACKDGKNCKRKICFFAHSARQLRIIPEVSCEAGKYDEGLALPSSLNHGHCCCLACHFVISSPTSTLLGMANMSPPVSPSLSPPLSQVKKRSISGFSPISRYTNRLSKLRSGVMSYKDSKAPGDPNHAKRPNGTEVGRVPMATRVLLESGGENVRSQWDRGRHGFLNLTSDKKGVDPRDKCGLSCSLYASGEQHDQSWQGILEDVCVRKWVSALANWWPTCCSSVCIGRAQQMVCGLLSARECDQVA